MQKKYWEDQKGNKCKTSLVISQSLDWHHGGGRAHLLSFPTGDILLSGKVFSMRIRTPLSAFHDATCTLAHANLCSSLSLVPAAGAIVGRMCRPYQFFLVDLSVVPSPHPSAMVTSAHMCITVQFWVLVPT